MKKIITLIFIVSLVFTGYTKITSNNSIISYTVAAKNITFYLTDAQGIHFKNFQNLKKSLQSNHKELIFAMNGGMYNRDLSPQGLYIGQGTILKEIDQTQEAYGNFYMQPNGIFYITKKGKAQVTQTKDFIYRNDINYATQSGPMLVIDGKLHHRFMPQSKNIHIRNGVGILPNGDLLFAISKKKINFYNFATFFKENGCKNALYLDGFVSRIYLPKKGIRQKDSLFGVIIAEVDSAKIQ